MNSTFSDPMRRFLTFLFLVPFVWSSLAQSISIGGMVAVQNSKHNTGRRQHVEGASIRAPFARSTTSDRDGRFVLPFTGLQPGTPVRITVEKPGLAVVNEQDLSAWVLGTDRELRVVMATPEQLAADRIEYHRIIVAGINTGFEREVRRLRDGTTGLVERLASIEQRYGRTAADLGQAVEVLTKQRDAALACAEQWSQELVSIDLDHASELQTRAMERFRVGDVDSLLVLLDEGVLEAALVRSAEEHKKGGMLVRSANEEIWQIASAHRLRITALRTRLDYSACLRAVDGLERIIDEQPDAFQTRDRADAAFLRAELLAQTARFAEAYAVLGAWAKVAPSQDPMLSEALVRMGGVLYRMDRLDSAQIVIDQALASIDTTTREGGLLAASALDHAGGIAGGLGRQELAQVRYERSLALRLRFLPPDHRDVLTSMLLVAVGNARRYKHEEAEEGFRKCAEAFRDNGPKDDAFLARLYFNRAGNCLDAEQWDSAVAYYARSQMLIARSVVPEHPLRVYSYHALSNMSFRWGRQEESIAYADTGLVLALRTLGPDHNMTVALHEQKAKSLGEAGRCAEAIPEYRVAFDATVRALGPDHPTGAYILMNMQGCYRSLLDTVAVLSCYDEAARIYAAHNGSENRQVYWTRLSKAATLVGYGRSPEAIPLFQEFIPKMTAVRGDDLEGKEEVLTDYAEALYRLQRYEECDSVLQEARAIKADAKVCWWSYKVAMALDDRRAAVDHLAAALREMAFAGTDSEGLLPEARSAMAVLARDLGRTDLLEEFGPE